VLGAAWTLVDLVARVPGGVAVYSDTRKQRVYEPWILWIGDRAAIANTQPKIFGTTPTSTACANSGNAQRISSPSARAVFGRRCATRR
jgi:hypothetical protein